MTIKHVNNTENKDNTLKKERDNPIQGEELSNTSRTNHTNRTEHLDHTNRTNRTNQINSTNQTNTLKSNRTAPLIKTGTHKEYQQHGKASNKKNVKKKVTKSLRKIAQYIDEIVENVREVNYTLNDKEKYIEVPTDSKEQKQTLPIPSLNSNEWKMQFYNELKQISHLLEPTYLIIKNKDTRRAKVFCDEWQQAFLTSNSQVLLYLYNQLKNSNANMQIERCNTHSSIENSKAHRPIENSNVYKQIECNNENNQVQSSCSIEHIHVGCDKENDKSMCNNEYRQLKDWLKVIEEYGVFRYIDKTFTFHSENDNKCFSNGFGYQEGETVGLLQSFWYRFDENNQILLMAEGIIEHKSSVISEKKYVDEKKKEAGEHLE